MLNWLKNIFKKDEVEIIEVKTEIIHKYQNIVDFLKTFNLNVAEDRKKLLEMYTEWRSSISDYQPNLTNWQYNTKHASQAFFILLEYMQHKTNLIEKKNITTC